MAQVQDRDGEQCVLHRTVLVPAQGKGRLIAVGCRPGCPKHEAPKFQPKHDKLKRDGWQ